MPINISNPNGTIRRDVAERFQILNLLEAEEDVRKIRMEAYFMTSIYLSDEKISEAWNPEVLVFDCKDDPELEAAMIVIQSRIGQKRYEQITAPPEISEPVENPEIIPPIENS
ncbi:hypothetical protein [Microcoleus sp. Pol12B5]|uniref:hypothetical protein n=1 Tax=Microcoleus sp. Pol12B5 TaxID=3055396 RepID=UPI002FD2920F